VTFRVGGRDLAGPLDEVREVVRAAGVESMAGTRAPVNGVLVLRGSPLPVVDLRTDAGRAAEGRNGDVLVLLADATGELGVAVDRVLAVLPATR
jgi:chemotaxis signal transduction protein